MTAVPAREVPHGHHLSPRRLSWKRMGMGTIVLVAAARSRCSPRRRLALRVGPLPRDGPGGAARPAPRRDGARTRKPRSRSTAGSRISAARWTPASKESRSGVAAGQQSFADHLGKSTHLLEQVGERLGRLHEASQKIEKLAGDVTRLEDLLKPPKLRGRARGDVPGAGPRAGPAAGRLRHPAPAGRRASSSTPWSSSRTGWCRSTASSRSRTSGGRERPRTSPSGAGRGSSSAATSASTSTRSPRSTSGRPAGPATSP